MKNLGLKTKYPQNYIIGQPVFGALILFAFNLGFTFLYQPLNTQKSQWFNFELTMLLYSLTASFAAWLSIVLLKKIGFFSEKNNWSLLKELISAYLVLQAMGIAIFLVAFILENPTEVSRWNLTTFFDSCKYSFLIGIFPFAFFTAINYKYAFNKGEAFELYTDNNDASETLINISSSLKKESLSFRINEFLFVSSEGNYVVFYLYRDKEVRKILIRNSISNIENQFADFPKLFRCHRAFIVNIDKVHVKKGNALGYLLNIENCDMNIPVSRQNVKTFDHLFVRAAI